MADALPHPDEVRVLLTRKDLAPADCDRTGDQFLAADRPSVAAMFYERSKNPDRARRILDRALKDGDAFLMDWIARVAPDLATPEAWGRVGEAAMAQKKFSFAKLAFEKAGDDARSARATEELLKALA
jgi:hypothetical protein